MASVQTPGAAPTIATAVPSGIDAAAVQRARQEIQELLREVTELSRSSESQESFFQGALARTLTALAGVSAAIWTTPPDGGDLDLVCQINLKATGLSDASVDDIVRHNALLRSVMASPQGALIPPKTMSADPNAPGNPTPYLIVAAPFRDDSGVCGVLEVFQRPNTPPAAQRSFGRFVTQVCDLVSDYLHRCRLRGLVDRQLMWEQIEAFARSVHRTLDLRSTASTLANEGRRLIACDRVSVVLRRGKRAKVIAVSGQDSVEDRSALVRRMADLSAKVIQAGDPLWFDGSSRDLPPQVEHAVHEYLDVSHCRYLGVLPLVDSSRDAKNESSEIFGALIIEQLEDDGSSLGMMQRADVVVKHGAPALAHAVEIAQLPLLGLWKVVANSKLLVQTRLLPKTILVGAIVALAALALIAVPADFELEARGTLQPSHRRDIFAAADGEVVAVPVRHGQDIAVGAVLAEMRNTDLEVQLADVTGKREATDKQIRALERTLLDEAKLTPEEQNRLTGQVLQLRKTYESLERQLDLLQQKQVSLTVASPIPGQVVTWQVEDRILRRPVRQGQVLLSLADPTGPWELEVLMPEDRMGFLNDALASGEPLRVEYILASDPGHPHEGQIIEVHGRAEVRGETGNCVLVRVAIDKNDVASLRPGATVVARVDCGKRPLGYVWFHDVWSFIQQKVLFRL